MKTASDQIKRLNLYSQFKWKASCLVSSILIFPCPANDDKHYQKQIEAVHFFMAYINAPQDKKSFHEIVQK